MRVRTCFHLAALALACAAPSVAHADVTVPPIISEGMVLQRDMKAPLWGTAGPGEKVVVTFRGKTAKTVGDRDGRWRVNLDPGSAGGPFDLTIQGTTRVRVKEVWVGDVWLCSGQSNMEWTTGQSLGAEEIKSLSPDVNIRLLKVAGSGALSGWQPATPENILNFSGVGYYFGRELHATEHVPVGLIQSAVGGTAVERWMSPEKQKALGFGDKIKPDAGIHYASMIKPLAPFGLKGAIWYQGESNTGNAGDYEKLFSGMIDEWRLQWGQGNFPFLFVQLARIGKPGGDVGGWPALRDAQLRTLSLPRTGMATIFDVTDGDIHPRDKKSVGIRLALSARAVAYGDHEVEYTGPVLKSAKRSPTELTLTFDHAAGLAARGGELKEIEVKSGLGEYKPVTGRVEGNRVIVALPAGALTGALSVRYGWRAFPEGNLYNAAGLPASPFVVEGIQ